jgi:hypothetical protein
MHGKAASRRKQVVLHLLWAGQLYADLTRPLSADTPVGLKEAVTG